MDNTNVTFLFQFGRTRNVTSISLCDTNLKTLKEMACTFINTKIPENGLNYFFDDILLFRHDYTNPNVLQIINSVAEIVNETLIEIVITASPCSYSHIDMKPHSLIVHSFKAPTFCDFCGEMLFGLVRQGLKCEGCGQNYHKRCVVKIPNNCNSAIESSSRVSCLQFSRYFANESTTYEHRGNESMNFFEPTKSRESQEVIDPNNTRASFIHLPYQGRVQIPHTFMVHTYGIPTVCQHCKKLLRGIFKQGFQCRDCSYNAHKKCVVNVSQDCKGEKQTAEHESTNERKAIHNESYNNSQISATRCLDKKKEQNSPTDINLYEDKNLVNLSNEQSESSSLSPPSNNIPLMRIVQSVKHTKKRGSQAIKEGWLVHFTNLDKTIRFSFWRLDSKTITLFISEQSTKYHKEIPLKEILSVDSNHNVNNENNFCFEIRTANIHYFVGQHIIYAQRDSQIHLSSMDTGIGADKAKKWEMAIKQSLMHVTNTQCWKSEENVHDMGQLYQIFAEEVLGSGQFGVVYGGLHKKSGREVAVKVIDKLRFPTKQESQLKNEVAILQNISHCGIVNLERTFETAERIFVVMEKLRGDMLEMILSCEQGRLTERVAKFLITQILIALKHLHNKNIVHCDLKPENVLLSSDSEFPQVKLCDFGYARIIGEKSFRRSVVGTPAYLAPEVLCNKGYNRSLDMWSVGVIIYVSLSGTFPFNEEEDINDQIQNAAFMYPVDTWKEISSNAIDLINNLLQVNQRKRYTVDKSLQHSWLQGKQTYEDLIALEAQVGTKYLTHEADEIRWAKNNDI